MDIFQVNVEIKPNLVSFPWLAPRRAPVPCTRESLIRSAPEVQSQGTSDRLEPRAYVYSVFFQLCNFMYDRNSAGYSSQLTALLLRNYFCVLYKQRYVYAERWAVQKWSEEPDVAATIFQCKHGGLEAFLLSTISPHTIWTASSFNTP